MASAEPVDAESENDCGAHGGPARVKAAPIDPAPTKDLQRWACAGHARCV